MAGPLEGITVIDVSRFIAGPWCSMLLADMGADVIKVESRKGEASRGLLPFAGDGENQVSLYFTQYNKNKRSITLDFYKPEGIAILKQLIAKADVLVENFRPGTLDKMGLTEEVLNSINPSLVVTSISGFGQTGPYRDRAAFDCIGQAMGGLMSVTGEIGGDPLLCGTWVADFTTGIYSAFGTVCALYHKQKTGEGQRLDLSLVECVVSLLSTAVPNYAANGIVQPLRGNRDNVTGPANAFRCSDGLIYMHAGTDPLFERLAKLMDREDMLTDPRYYTANERMKRIEEVEAVVQDWMQQYTAEEAEAMLVKAGIPVSKIANVEDIVKNPQLRHRDAIVYRDYPGVGEIALPGIPVKMSKTPGEVKRRPPLLGEHSEEILQSFLGLSREEIGELSKNGVI